MMSNSIQSHSLPTKCGTCDRPTESPLFCSGCHTLQSAEGLDLFELLGMERAYDIDPGDLRRRYYDAARAVHPDRFSGSPEETARLSMQLSARLNRAFEVLSDPVLRAEYLLEVSGGVSAAQDKAVPAEVLNDALSLREEIDDARAAGNSAVLAELRTVLRAKFDGLRGTIATAARALPGDEYVRSRLRIGLNSAKYYQRLLEQVD